MENKHNKMTDFTIEALIKGDTSTNCINQHIKEHYPDLCLQFVQLMQLVLDDTSFDVEQPNIETLEHLDIFLGSYKQLVDSSKNTSVTLEELIELDNSADYIDEPPGPIFAVFSLLGLLSLLNTKDLNSQQYSDTKNTIEQSFLLAKSHASYANFRHDISQNLHIDEVNKQSKQTSNFESKARTEAVIDYIAEATTFIKWILPKTSVETLFTDITKLISQGHTEKLHAYFGQCSTMSSPKLFDDAGGIKIKDTRIERVIDQIQKYFDSNTTDDDLNYLKSAKPPSKKFNPENWNRRSKYPEYSLVVSVASSATGSVGLAGRLEDLIEKDHSKLYISLSNI